jgi:hypothetical protein
METVCSVFADLAAFGAVSGMAKAGDARADKLMVTPRAMRSRVVIMIFLP